MFRAFSFVCILTVLLGGCQTKYQAKEELLKEGMNQLAKGNAGGAIVLLKDALEKDQKYFEARLQLAKAYATAGKFEAAEKELQKLVRQRPDSREVHIEMARMHLRKSEPDEALRELATGGTMADATGDEAELWAWAYALKGRYANAVAHLSRSIAADPGRIKSKLVLARIHPPEGAWKEAEASIADILKQEPANREALLLLAAIQAEQRNFKGAHDTYDRALKESPDDADVLYRKGLLYNEQGDHDAALAIGDAVIKRYPKSGVGHLMRGIALYNKKQLKEAAVSLQQAVTLQPSVASHYYLAATRYGLRDLEQASGQIQKALDRKPEFAQGRVLLSMILMSKKQVDHAIREAKKAVELDADNAAAHNVLGNAYLQKGMFNEGVAELNRALERNPKLADAHINKGLVYLRRGKTGEGEAELLSAVWINPDVLDARMVLASYYQKIGALGKALRVLQKGLKGNPSDSLMYNMMAETYLQQNSLNEAMAYYRKAIEANPDDTYAPLRLATLHVARGERDKAVQELTAYVDRAPGNIRALAALASLHEAVGNDPLARKYYKQVRAIGAPEGYVEEARYYLRKRDVSEAVSLLNEAIKKYPSNEALHEFKGKVQLSAKDCRSAIKTFDELEKLNPRIGLPYLLNAYHIAGEHAKALEKIEKELRKDPRRLDLRARRSGVYLMLGKKREAEDNAREIISSHPNNAEGYMALATVYHSEGDLGKAIETLAKAPVRSPELALMLSSLYMKKKDYPAALAQSRKAEELKKDNLPAMVQTGMVLHTMGRKQAAVDQYLRVLRLNPNYAPILNNLAYLYAEDRDPARALQYAVRAYVIAPGDGAVNDTLGYILLKKGNVDEGLKALKNAVALLPDNATAHYHLGLAYREHGDTALAIESLSQAVGLGDFPENEAARRLLEKLGNEKRS